MKSEKIKVCAWIVLVGFTFSVFIHYALHWYFKNDYPLATFLCVPSEVWSDFFGCTVMNKRLDPFHNVFRGFGNNYPPFAYLGIATFTQLGYKVGSIVYAVFFVLGFWFYMVTNLRGRGGQVGGDAMSIFVLCLLTYPFLFAFERLNTENLIFILVAGFYLLMKRNSRDHWASLLLGAATAMKVYPGVFLLAFINKRRWKPAVYTTLAAVILTCIAMAVFRIGPRELLDRYAWSAPTFMSFTTSYNGINYSSSLFATFRTIHLLWHPERISDAVGGLRLLHKYNVFAPVLAIFIASGFLSRRLDLWEKLTLALVIILVIPPVSFDYKLLYVFIPLMAFFDAPTSPGTSRTFVILFSVLLIPKAFVVFFGDVSIETLINPPILLAMAALILWKAWVPRREEAARRSLSERELSVDG